MRQSEVRLGAGAVCLIRRSGASALSAREARTRLPRYSRPAQAPYARALPWSAPPLRLRPSWTPALVLTSPGPRSSSRPTCAPVGCSAAYLPPPPHRSCRPAASLLFPLSRSPHPPASPRGAVTTIAMQALRAAIVAGRVGFTPCGVPAAVVRAQRMAPLSSASLVSRVGGRAGSSPAAPVGLRALATASSSRIPVDGQIVDMNGCVGGGWPCRA